MKWPSEYRLHLLALLMVLACTGAAAVLAQTGGAPAAERKPQGPAHESAPFTAEPRLDLILGRASPQSVTFNLLAHKQDEAGLELRLLQDSGAGASTVRREGLSLKKGQPKELHLQGLQADAEYRYELRQADQTLSSGRLHTQRLPGAKFSFTISADSHLDQNTDPALYERTLKAVRAERPDFHIDLGDTFMVDKHAGRDAAAAQYLAQRHYFGMLGLPLYLVLGNHDGEDRKLLKEGPQSLGVWANQMRRQLFPNPQPDGFYKGNQVLDPWVDGFLQDYYAWTWGDAQFIVLNPYWHAPARRTQEPWHLSLGEAQYRWLRDTLQSSQARYKFIFVHQLIGGRERQGRGGVEAAPFGEWGGQNADGSEGLSRHRPAWEEPVHALLRRTGVNAVFHGHDHVFAAQQLEGIHYIEVPQPAHPGDGHQNSAAEYGYRQGVIHGESGYLRVSVDAQGVSLDYFGTAQTARPRLLHHQQLAKERP